MFGIKTANERVLEARLRLLEERLAEVKDSLLKQQRQSAEEIARVKAEAHQECVYARELVRSAMLKGGMWPASEQPSLNDVPDPMPRNVPLPLHLAQAEAEAEEIDAYMQSLIQHDDDAPSH